MLCQKCYLKNECREDCAALEEYIKSRSKLRATSSSNDVCPSAIPKEVARLCKMCRVKDICRDECAALKAYIKSKCNFKAISSRKDVYPSAIPEDSARLCQKCQVKSNCVEDCAAIEEYLESKRNYKTTYTSKEVSLTEFAEGMSKVWDEANELFIGTKMLKSKYYSLSPQVRKLIDGLDFTNRQRQIIDLYKRGINMAAIGRQLGISRQAVNQALFGHPKHGGGIVRKIQMAIASDEELCHYLSTK